MAGDDVIGVAGGGATASIAAPARTRSSREEGLREQLREGQRAEPALGLVGGLGEPLDDLGELLEAGVLVAVLAAE